MLTESGRMLIRMLLEQVQQVLPPCFCISLAIKEAAWTT